MVYLALLHGCMTHIFSKTPKMNIQNSTICIQPSPIWWGLGVEKCLKVCGSVTVLNEPIVTKHYEKRNPQALSIKMMVLVFIEDLLS